MPLLPSDSKQKALAYGPNLTEGFLELTIIHFIADSLDEHCSPVMLHIGVLGRHFGRCKEKLPRLSCDRVASEPCAMHC